MVFGFLLDGIWHEMIGADETEVLGYSPLQWAPVPRERRADYAMG